MNEYNQIIKIEALCIVFTDSKINYKSRPGSSAG